MKCPHCGRELDNKHCYDTEFEDSVYYDYCVGNCLPCHKNYSWTEVFSFSHVKDLEESDEKETED